MLEISKKGFMVVKRPRMLLTDISKISVQTISVFIIFFFSFHQNKTSLKHNIHVYSRNPSRPIEASNFVPAGVMKTIIQSLWVAETHIWNYLPGNTEVINFKTFEKINVSCKIILLQANYFFLEKISSLVNIYFY